jgi:serine/threonine-protein kinase
VRQFSENVPAGVVLSAKPGKGDAIRGSKVQLVVSKGPERFSIAADLVGKPKDDVLNVLKGMPIQVTVKDTYDNSVPAGSVSGFDPPASTPLPRNAAVTVLVSKGHQPVKVPNVVGSTPDAATAALQQLGFKVTRGPDGRSASVQTGQVMSVTPGPDAGAQAYGSTVTIVVSAGLPQVAVPDVGGKKKDEAVKILQQAGFKVDVQTFISGNRVRQQSPAAGAMADQGSTVQILVSF